MNFVSQGRGIDPSNGMLPQDGVLDPRMKLHPAKGNLELQELADMLGSEDSHHANLPEFPLGSLKNKRAMSLGFRPSSHGDP